MPRLASPLDKRVATTFISPLKNYCTRRSLFVRSLL